MQVDQETYRGHTIVIKYDEDPVNPCQEDDNICVIHTAHRRYNFGNQNHNSLESIQQAEKEARTNGDIILPLYMYDHSGITISLHPFGGQLPQGHAEFDSGQVGVVIVSRKNMLEAFNKKVFSETLKKKSLEIAEAEVDALDHYLRGSVYGYIIDDEDSCGGYHEIEEAMTEAKSVVDSIIITNIKRHCK